MQHKQSGFTLIELIIVIVILGILAVTAAPKFIDLQGDAVASVVESRAAALQGEIKLVHAKALVQGLTSGTQTITTDFGQTRIREGYPFEHGVSLGFFLNPFATQVSLGITDTCPHEYCYQSSITNTPVDDGVASRRAFAIWPKGYTYNDRCKILFSDGQPPIIETATSDC